MMDIAIDNSNHQTSPSDSTTASVRLANVQSLIRLEQSLTSSLEQIKPILSLPTPKSQSEIETILALARTYSTRTSAPPGWTSDLPVVHFATPSPYPHQLRGGVLGALQLQLVREEKNRIQREKVAREEEEERKMRNEKKRKGEICTKDAKKREVMDHEQQENEDTQRGKDNLKLLRVLKQKQQQQQEVTMNLSSSEESEDESESDSEETETNSDD